MCNGLQAEFALALAVAGFGPQYLLPQQDAITCQAVPAGTVSNAILTAKMVNPTVAAMAADALSPDPGSDDGGALQDFLARAAVQCGVQVQVAAAPGGPDNTYACKSGPMGVGGLGGDLGALSVDAPWMCCQAGASLTGESSQQQQDGGTTTTVTTTPTPSPTPSPSPSPTPSPSGGNTVAAGQKRRNARSSRRL